jgi:hypothetical protein
MTHRILRIAVAALIVLALAAWFAAEGAPAAHADRDTGRPDVSRTFVIPAASTAILRWTFEARPTKSQTATFQISADRRHWRTLKHVAVPAGTKSIRTTWKAISHAGKRYFRFDTKTVKSDLVVIRVK